MKVANFSSCYRLSAPNRSRKLATFFLTLHQSLKSIGKTARPSEYYRQEYRVHAIISDIRLPIGGANLLNSEKGERLPHWDLSNVYPALESRELSQALKDLEIQLVDLEKYLGDKGISADVQTSPDPATPASLIDGYLDRIGSLLKLFSSLIAYLHSFVATDSFNELAKKMMSELDPYGVRLENQEVQFRGWIGQIAKNPDLLEAAIESGGLAGEHAFFLRERAEQSQYMMSEGEESLASELSISGANAWSKLQGVVSSQLKAPFERDGEVANLPITVIQTFYNDPEESVRRQAYEVELEAWSSVREPLAASLNGIKGTVNTLNKRRGREDALHQTLDQAQIDRQTLEALLGAMRNSFPMFRRYWKAKASRLGKEQLAWWDIQAPVGRTEKEYSFEEASDFIVEQFGNFSGQLADYAQRAFDERWIDAEPREGKRGGAFCMPIHSVEESRILCNFDGSLDQVMTIAHELGHGYHNFCQKGKTVLQRRNPMTLAETASIFCETIVFDAALEGAQDVQERIAILETSLIGASQVIVDIYSRYLFEAEVFERRATADLSAEDFCQIMLEKQRETYGEGLDANFLHPYMWAWKPHYYSPNRSFYNFPYAFGLLFGLGIYAIYQERGRAFLPEYDALLASTGESQAVDLAARFDIDIRDEEFWRSSLDRIGERVNLYTSL